MLRFVVRRLLLLVPILLGLSILVFLWIRALPGDPASALLGERATEQTVEQVREQYGLDRPLYVQYLAYLRLVVIEGNLGTSITSRRPVTEEISRRFPATIELAVSAMIFAIFLGVPLGFFAAKRYGGVVDNASLVGSLLGISIPIFFLALILKWIFAVELGLFPTIGRQSSEINIDHPTNFYVLDGILALDPVATADAVWHLVLPAIALGSIPLAIIARITRAAVLDVQNEDYVRTARAKGLPARIVDRRHGSDPHREGVRDPGHGLVARGRDRSARLPRAPGRDPLRRRRVRPGEPLRGRDVRPRRPAGPGAVT